ncbi:MAG: phage portal protein, partial [Angustibacter sp.]
KTGYAESGTSLRLRMVPPLAKARDIRSRFDPVLKKALVAACELEAAWGVRDAAVPESVNITWKDGLPEDPREKAQIEASRLEAGNTSRESSVRRLDGGTDREIREEVGRMDSEEDRISARDNPARTLLSRLDNTERRDE